MTQILNHSNVVVDLGNSRLAYANVLVDTSGNPIVGANGMAIQAGEQHIGEVDTWAKNLIMTPVMSASPDYAANEAIGALVTLANAFRIANKPALWQSLLVEDKANQKPQMTLFLARATPAGSTITDNAAFAWGASGAALLVCGYQKITTGDYTATYDGVTFARFTGIGQVLDGSGTDLFAWLIADAAYNGASTGDLQLTIGLV